ncbi:hypothetical protein GCM10010358_58330 [Streptomyces minutiscleroticus]|uniref:Uncharacterized protein n=1 Tax=Streptomyces minutiscleroticus TaxID=68238 RepID=A0A918NV08_9ACTN|nr:hypothetical protein GCM10010358_58330 [Streptomyces minutiscleroticus]
MRRPPHLAGLAAEPGGRAGPGRAKVLLRLGDDVTAARISPAGRVPADSPAGHWLTERGTERRDLNQYSTRRGNQEVMLRGAFTDPAVPSLLLTGSPGQGGWVRTADRTASLPVYEAAPPTYRTAGYDPVIVAGRTCGAGPGSTACRLAVSRPRTEALRGVLRWTRTPSGPWRLRVAAAPGRGDGSDHRPPHRLRVHLARPAEGPLPADAVDSRPADPGEPAGRRRRCGPETYGVEVRLCAGRAKPSRRGSTGAPACLRDARRHRWPARPSPLTSWPIGPQCRGAFRTRTVRRTAAAHCRRRLRAFSGRCSSPQPGALPGRHA